MTAQKIYNIVKGNLLRQKKKSLRNSQPRLRGIGKTKCAIGFLIPDSKYETTMEGEWIEDLAEEFNFIPNDIKEPFRFLNDLRMIHDLCSVTAWKIELHMLAKKYNLRP